MDFLVRFDRFLLNTVFQPFAHWFQDWTGKDSFFLARCFIFIHCFLAVLCDFEEDKIGVKLVFMIFLDLFLILFDIVFYLVAKSFYDHYNKPGLMSMVVIWLLPGRCIAMFGLLLTPILGLRYGLLHVVLEEGACICFLVFLYFLSCTPKPPSKSKVRKHIEKLKELFQINPQIQPA